MLALRAAEPASRSVTLGTVDVRVAPARGGRLDVYVPVVDWGVRAHPYRAPFAVELEFRSLDRDAALAALRSGGTADTNLTLLRQELGDVVDGRPQARGPARLSGRPGGRAPRRRAARRVEPPALARPRAARRARGLPRARRAFRGVSVSRFDYEALREPTFYARGEELPRLLAFSERLLRGRRGLRGLLRRGRSRADPADRGRRRAGRRESFARTLVVASDLHSNTLVLPALSDFTRGKTVLFAGDLTQRGTRFERPIVPRWPASAAPSWPCPETTTRAR